MTLTPRETEVYRLLMSGKSGVECAKELGIDLGTFKHHAHWVYLKHGVSGRIELMSQNGNYPYGAAQTAQQLADSFKAVMKPCDKEYFRETDYTFS